MLTKARRFFDAAGMHRLSTRMLREFPAIESSVRVYTCTKMESTVKMINIWTHATNFTKNTIVRMLTENAAHRRNVQECTQVWAMIEAYMRL